MPLSFTALAVQTTGVRFHSSFTAGIEQGLQSKMQTQMCGSKGDSKVSGLTLAHKMYVQRYVVLVSYEK